MADLGYHHVEPLHNPEAIRDYYFLDSGVVEKAIMQDLIIKAKQHLAAVGWTFLYVFDKHGNRKKVKYDPPDGSRKHVTLRSACKYYLEIENGGGGQEIKSADKCKTKRKVRFVNEENVGKIEAKKFDGEDEDRSLCVDNRQFSFDDLEIEDGLKEVQRKMRGLHLENREYKFDDSGENVNVGKTELNSSRGNEQETGDTGYVKANQEMDNVIEVLQNSEEEEVQEINYRLLKKKKVSIEKEVDIGRTKFKAREKRKRRLTACDLFGERMLRCMQGI